MKLGKVYFKNKEDFEAAKSALALSGQNQVFVLNVDLDRVDPSIFENGIVVREEVLGVPESETKELCLWLNETDVDNYFLDSLRESLQKYRRLTPKQLLALKKIYLQEEGRKAVESRPSRSSFTPPTAPPAFEVDEEEVPF